MTRFEPTAEQQQRVRELRAAGVGKKKISTALGIQKKTLERHFGPQLGLKIIESTAKPTPAEILCTTCGGPIAQPGHGRRRMTCGEECRRARIAARDKVRKPAKGLRAPRAARPCAFCGRAFTPRDRRKNLCCCRRCGNKFRRLRWLLHERAKELRGLAAGSAGLAARLAVEIADVLDDAHERASVPA